MRLLLIDIDSLRADHLGCYGYPRSTTPSIDRLAEQGARFDQVYVSDAPCLPSRTAWATGRFGIKNGVVAHGGRRAEPFDTSRDRIQDPDPATKHWFAAMRDAGHLVASISPFAARHAAWWYLAGLSEWRDTGKGGNERADEVYPVAAAWLHEHAHEPAWVLHVNLWDPHTPYRTPAHARGVFRDQPLPLWIDAATLQRQWNGYGTLSARDPMGYWFPSALHMQHEDVPEALETLDDVRAWIDAYDEGIAYADAYVGRLIDELDQLGVLEDTTIVVTSDHGENQGELGVYGDHQTADVITTRVPFVWKGPGIAPGFVDEALHYQFDLAATLLDWAGAEIPSAWDGRSIAYALRERRSQGRSMLVTSQMAWSCQRQVRFGRWSYLRTYHHGLKDLPEDLLFDVVDDPHLACNLATELPDVVREAKSRLLDWHDVAMASSLETVDPMWTVLREGGPSLPRNLMPSYLERLRSTGRADAAMRLEHREARRIARWDERLD